MARKPSAINNPKKEVRKLFERTFDIKKLDYENRIRPSKGKAMVLGAAVAGTLYLIAYGAAYGGFNANILPVEALAKLVWIMMIPTTIVGLLVWQIAKNRMEYPIRQEVRAYIENTEKNGGTLWRFKPVWEHFDGNNTTIKKALVKSEEQTTEKLDLEDYCAAVLKLHQIIILQENKEFPSRVAESVISNFKTQVPDIQSDTKLAS